MLRGLATAKNSFVIIASRKMAAQAKDSKCIAILRETYNVWERRAPLSPDHVKTLVEKGYKVIVQPFERRAFRLEDYVAAGAVVQEDVSPAGLILGVKSVPPEELVPDRTYSIFTHTIKAQNDNMPLLDALLAKKCQVIDHEMLGNVAGAMGVWAGRVGMLDILHGLGLRLWALGFTTPFLHVSLAHNYRTLADAYNSIESVGADIKSTPLPAGLCPLIVIFTGAGNVSQGAQDILKHLPHEYVTVPELAKIVKNGARDKVYACICDMADHLRRNDGTGFGSMDQYLKHPELYYSEFENIVAPYASIIINGIVWQPDHPRLITNECLRKLLAPKTEPTKPGMGIVPHRLLAISDVSADPGGSLEFMTDCTTIDKPFYIRREHPACDTDRFDVPDGVLVCSVDNMPAQMAQEAAKNFSDLLIKFIPEMLKCDSSVDFSDLKVAEEVKRAIITSNGKLTPKYEYINDLRKKKGV